MYNDDFDDDNDDNDYDDDDDDDDDDGDDDGLADVDGGSLRHPAPFPRVPTSATHRPDYDADHPLADADHSFADHPPHIDLYADHPFA